MVDPFGDIPAILALTEQNTPPQPEVLRQAAVSVPAQANGLAQLALSGLG